ncbi:MAG: LptE family protein [Candidatus Cryptobacteroides sp.]|nr:LPS assembly lipoprotein LptE [Bacteroidales bacterium]MDY3963649.1 LptE family protein [Candidatus Cryptobacteroides sp.]
MGKFGKILSAAAASMALAVTALLVHSCGIYSFSGTSIQPDVKTVTINYFEYKALRVNPSLSNDLTEALKDKFRKMTRLEQVEMDGDIEVTGTVTGYDVRAMAVTAEEVASQNRLTVTIKISFTNRKHPEDDFPDKSFSAYSDYDSTQSLDAVEATLCEEIIEKLCEDIFNATVANW